MDILEDQLKSLSLRGIFPGPLESSEDFFVRADSFVPQKHLPCALLLSKIFNTTPDWVQIETGSKGLFFWEGAATWIEENADGMRSCKVQLKDTWLTRLYPKEELIAHEIVHAMRLMFDEKRFEEVLAYQTSKNRFRRYFGPLFSDPTESKFFIALLFASWAIYWVEVIFNVHLGGGSILFLPLWAIGWGVLRLRRSQRVLSAALCNLQAVVGQGAPSLAIAICLTDSEIEQFATSTPEEIRTFAVKAKEHSLRWRQLFVTYFSAVPTKRTKITTESTEDTEAAKRGMM
jgi:hypothetical protein